MISYEELVETVTETAELPDAENGRVAVSAVLSTLAHCLSPEDRERVSAELPGTFKTAVQVPGQTERRDGQDLVIEIAERLNTTPERARYVGQAVLHGLQASSPELLDHLRAGLRSDVLQVLAPAADSPDKARSADPAVPTELSDEEVRQALAKLTGWSGDHRGITRTVLLPEDRLAPLLDEVQRVAVEMNDRAETSRVPGGVSFTLRTGSGADAVVTEPDIWLAGRIDDIVYEVGSGGKPG